VQKTGVTQDFKRLVQKAGELARPLGSLLGRVLDAYARLQPRERMVVAVAAVLLAVFILVGGVIGPLVHLRSSLDTSIASKDTQLRKIYAMSSVIRGLRGVLDADTRLQDERFTLFGFLEELAVRLSINDRIEYMKPMTDSTGSSRETVEVKIRGLYMDDLVGLLLGIEASGRPLMIRHLNIKRQEKDANLDVTFQVVFYG